jgi:hypothetical protein
MELTSLETKHSVIADARRQGMSEPRLKGAPFVYPVDRDGRDLSAVLDGTAPEATFWQADYSLAARPL